MLVARSVRRSKVLFVDDEQHWRDEVGTSLAEAGFDVMIAANGTEAMAKADDPALGLLIVDEDLAGESGLMLTKYLRRNHPGVPALLCTTAPPRLSSALASEPWTADQCVQKQAMDALLAGVCKYLA
jgi:DNA-binding response OmpR family regulator